MVLSDLADLVPKWMLSGLTSEANAEAPENCIPRHGQQGSTQLVVKRN